MWAKLCVILRKYNASNCHESIVLTVSTGCFDIVFFFYSLSEKEVKLIELQNRDQDATTRYKAMQSAVKGRTLYVHVLT